MSGARRPRHPFSRCQLLPTQSFDHSPQVLNLRCQQELVARGTRTRDGSPSASSCQRKREGTSPFGPFLFGFAGLVPSLRTLLLGTFAAASSSNLRLKSPSSTNNGEDLATSSTQDSSGATCRLSTWQALSASVSLRPLKAGLVMRLAQLGMRPPNTP